MPRPSERTPRRPARPTSERIIGINAALAVAAVRPDDILRISHTRDVRSAIADMLREAAARRIPYNEVSDDDLSRLVESTHHEGICVFARPRPLMDLPALSKRLATPGARGALALDRVVNPHNLGAIVRSAAYFGIDAVLFASEHGRSPLTPAAVRVAEGGAESVGLAVVPDLAGALTALRSRGVTVIGTDAHARDSIFARPLRAPSIVVMGSEHAGMSPSVRAACERLVTIPGAGAVDSLNVSVAAGVLIAEMVRGR